MPTDFDPENFEVTSFLIPTLLNTRGAALGVHRKCLCLLGTTASNTADTFCLGWREWPIIWDDENALIMQEGLTSGYVAAGFADFSDDFIVTGIYNTTEDAVSHAIIAIEKACTLNISETGKISLISSSELDENAGAVKTVQGDELNGLLLGQLSPVQDLPNTLNVLDKVLVAWPSRPISLSDGNISVVKIEDFVDYNFLTTLNAPPTAKMLCLVGSGVILAGGLSGYDPIIDSELLSRCIRWTLPYSPGSPLDGPPFASYQVWPQTYFQILDAEPRAVWSNGPFAYVATDRLLYKFQIIEGQFGRGAADIIHRSSGCAGPRAWCHTDKGTFFLSQNGIFVCNGESVEKVSEPIGPLFSSGALNTSNLDRVIGTFNQKTRQVIFFVPWQTASRYCNAAVVFELDGNRWWTWFPANQERGLFFADVKASPDGNLYGIGADGTFNLIGLHAENDGGHEIPVEFSMRPFYSMEAGQIARLEFLRVTYAKVRGEPEAYESPDADKIQVKIATKYRAAYPAIKERNLPTAISENLDEQGQFFEKRLNLGEKGYSFTVTFKLTSQKGGLKLKSIGHEGWNYGGSDR